LGAHTQTHPLLNRISLEEVRAEAVGSLRDLEREIGAALPVFAYPSGGVTDEIVRLLEREGFALAFTTEPGINDLGQAHPLRLRRINVGQRTNLTVLRAQLLPWTIYLNRWQPLLGA
jgi:peptidoglycan/xylan/chitin deacetylase (PgdA/CDA1 family)